MQDIPIIIVAYNRPHALERILGCLKKAEYPDSVKLLISVDGGGNEQVTKIAEKLDWPFGEKRVIFQKNNIGLRRHILACGDLSREYDAVILLEDDLYVSPVFYHYAVQAVNFYQSDERVAGISLYSHSFNETAILPFQPRWDESDVFFLQIPCSWGQCWTTMQWSHFKDWYQNKKSTKTSQNIFLPGDVCFWPANSWKRLFLEYMMEKDKYFVYPRVSFTTNFGDDGSHHEKTKVFQVPFQYNKKQFAFKALRDSDVVYDAFCEILPDRLNRLIPEFKKYNYAVDLYGTKPLDGIKSDYILTTRPCVSPLLRYGREIRPLEANVIENIRGSEISFVCKSNCKDVTYGEVIKRCSCRKELLYHYSLIGHFHFTRSSKSLNRNGLRILDIYRNYIFRCGPLALWIEKIEDTVPWPFRMVRKVLKAIGK